MTTNDICVLPEFVTTDIDTLLQVQENLEKGMTLEGRSRFRNRISKNIQSQNESETIYGKRIISSQCIALSNEINGWLEQKKARKAGNKTRAAMYLEQIDSETASYIALKTLINGISGQYKLVKLAQQIGSNICDEIQAQKIAEDNKQNHNVIKRVANTKGEYHRKYRTAKYMAEKRGVVFSRWSDRDCILVGKTIVELVVSKLGLINLETIRLPYKNKFKTVTIITPNSSTLEWIKDTCEKYQDLSPMYEPMVVPPLEWTTPFDGGYLTSHVKSLPLIKTNSKDFLLRIEDHPMPAVYKSINDIQNTAHRVNKNMLPLILEFAESGMEIEGLPSLQDIPLPEAPEDIDENAEAKKRFSEKKRKVIEDNLKLQSQRTIMLLVLKTAQKYQDFDAIWIPQQLDFRGRVYSVPLLNPQGEDYIKSLLTFAEGKPLGPTGVKWLAIHLSNLWGNDKVPFLHRELWTHENTKQILSYVEDPFTNRGWMDADKPFQFLAACFEWFGYITEGESFVSRIGVALDGSCSGLQNFGMALKCEETGKTVNLTPSEKPSDIYQDVINDVMDKMREDLGVDPESLSKEQAEELAKSRMRSFYEQDKRDYTFEELYSKVTSVAYDKKAKRVKLTDDEAAAQKIYMNTILPYHWFVFGMSRKTAKRSVMTYPYGSKQYGFSEQIKEDIMKPTMAKVEKLLKEKRITQDEVFDIFPFFNDGFDASRYIAEKLWNAVRRKVKKAAEAMDWLQDTARLVSKHDVRVGWDTPLNFPVEQFYMKAKQRQIETTFLGNAKARFTVYDDTKSVDSRKQASSVSPNFIHSLDATHLMMTVLYSDLTNWALVHDSFSTLAADTEQMYHDIRNAFFRLYSEHDVLEDFYQQMLELVPEEERGGIPKPPSKGQLDLALIYESQYSFA